MFKLISDEAIRACYTRLKMKPPEWIPALDREIRQTQLNSCEKQYQEKLLAIRVKIEAMSLMMLRFDDGKSYTEIPVKDTVEWDSFWKDLGV